MYTCVSVSTESMYLILMSARDFRYDVHVRMAGGPQLLERILCEAEQRLAVLIPRLQRRKRRVKDKERDGAPVVLLSALCYTLQLTFFTPDRMSQSVAPASIPGMRSPIVKGNETPVELSTDDVTDLRKFMVRCVLARA
jgi:hypothetical protein